VPGVRREESYLGPWKVPESQLLQREQVGVAGPDQHEPPGGLPYLLPWADDPCQFGRLRAPPAGTRAALGAIKQSLKPIISLLEECR
jgi:hypothetical protein